MSIEAQIEGVLRFHEMSDATFEENGKVYDMECTYHIGRILDDECGLGRYRALFRVIPNQPDYLAYGMYWIDSDRLWHKEIIIKMNRGN